MPGTFSQFSCKIIVPCRIIFKLKKKLGGDVGRAVDRVGGYLSLRPGEMRSACQISG